MITAHITTNDGKSFEHEFDTKRVKTVYCACQKILGAPLRNSIEDNIIRWNFSRGYVTISGYCWFGNRQDTARMRKEMRALLKEKL